MNKDIKKIAFPALEAFLQQVGLCVCACDPVVTSHDALRCQHTSYKRVMIVNNPVMKMCLEYVCVFVCIC